MSRGAEFDYKFGQKNNWRRTAWNRVVERLTVHPRDAVVLYLAGEEDLDRSVMLSKGFREHNLLAIERDKEVVKSLRSRGTITISANALDVLKAWPQDRKVDVVWLDLCCGVEDKVMQAVYEIQPHPAFRETAVFMVNFQRGREARASFVQSVFPEPPPTKHRGALFLATYYTIEAAREVEHLPESEREKAHKHLVRCFCQVSKSTLLSYKSSVYMDSCVFISIWRLITDPAAYEYRDLYRGTSIRRKIAPALALRTMKIDRTGPYGGQ